MPTDKKFTGQRLDATGLYYYNARYYDATIGRFISADTVVQSPAKPQSLNRYSYCSNNPLKYVDPSGHVVRIGGLSVSVIDAARYCPYLPAESARLITNITSTSLFQAYDKIRSIDKYVTSILESSSLIINIKNGPTKVQTITDSDGNIIKIGGQLGYTTSKYDNNGQIDVVISDHSFLDTVESQTKYLAHELVHAHHNVWDENDFIGDSQFEENCGNIYSSYICNLAGFENDTRLVSPFDAPALDTIGYSDLPTFPTSHGHDYFGTMYMNAVYELFGRFY